MTRWIWIAIVLALGCGKAKKEDPGPTCAAVTDHVYEVTRKAYPGHGDMAMGNRAADVARCEARKLTGTQRRCMLEAQSMEALALCLPRDKPDERKPRPTAAPPAPAPAAPAPAPPAPAAQ